MALGFLSPHLPLLLHLHLHLHLQKSSLLPISPDPQIFPFPITTAHIPELQIPISKPLSSIRASGENGSGGVCPGILDGDVLRRISAAKDADHVLDLFEEEKGFGSGGIVDVDDCCEIIEASFKRGNVDLALSIYSAMRSTVGRGKSENGNSLHSWKWDQPDVRTHALLVRRLAEALRVSDANSTIRQVSRVGIYSGQEVSFGKIVRCPACMIAIAVAQPQNGIQTASCYKCRYQYELVSGEVTSIDSEEVSMDISAWEKGLRFLQIMKDSIPAAIHTIVVCTPTGTARTHRFATKTVELPAQKGERVTIALATTSNLSRQIGPIKFNARSPKFNPGEPLCLTNHVNGQESQLLRAPGKDRNSFLLTPSIVLPALAILASGDAASDFIDLNIPRLVAVAAVTAVTLGTAVNLFVMPRLNQLPQRIVDTASIRQQLLSQYDMLQLRIKELTQAAEKEVLMLARMCQLENKIVAVGEPSYRARRNKIQRVCENLRNSLTARIELLESYARISSMIEIEVEMDSDVLAAEAESSAERVSQQIEQIMEIENLEERWKIQAEANDEVERLLSSQHLSPEHV